MAKLRTRAKIAGSGFVMDPGLVKKMTPVRPLGVSSIWRCAPNPCLTCQRF